MKMHIVGAGEVYTFERKCSDFFSQDFNWADEQESLVKDTTSFARRYSEGGVQKTFEVKDVTFTNSKGEEFVTNEDF